MFGVLLSFGRVRGGCGIFKSALPTMVARYGAGFVVWHVKEYYPNIRSANSPFAVSYTHLRAHETEADL
eukprot:1477068-Amphidinium_carterae.1